MIWDEWRSKYDQMSFNDQAEFYAKLQRAEVPSTTKTGFYSQAVVKYLQELLNKDHPKILELGGGRGALAYQIIQQCPNIELWENYDFPFPPRNDTPNYVMHPLTQWFWNYPMFQGYTHFVSVHTLEHLKARDVEKIFSVIQKIPDIIVEVPLPNTTPDWIGYDGSHILELSMLELIELFSKHKYYLFYIENTMLHFRRLNQ